MKDLKFIYLLLAVLLTISCKNDLLVDDEADSDMKLSPKEMAITPGYLPLPNGSFEEGTGNTFTDWTAFNGASTLSATTVPAEVYEGNRALKVVNTVSNGIDNSWKIQFGSAYLPTVSGRDYRIRVWAKATATGTNGFRFQIRGGTTQFLPHKKIGTSWALYEWGFTATADSTMILFNLGADANTYYIDNVSVSEVPATVAYSAIWGENGELWDKSRIPDFTNAGYKSGNQAIPDYPQSINVTTLGAVGDGVTDNTAVFKTAIKQCAENGTIYIPAGKYVLKDTLMIKRSGINIKGAGDATILYFTKGLEELYPRYNATSKQSPWSWEGGMITFSENISGSGIQSLKIEFPDNAWAGHNFHERAYNAIGYTKNAHDGWIKNVKMKGCDIGIWIGPTSHHITAEGWTLESGPVRAAGTKGVGHHGVNIYGGYNLFQNFEVKGKFHHDLSVESASSIFNVFRNGKGTDICLDHHNHQVRNNLFTNLNVGTGSRLYTSGGNDTPAGININETYWNITAINNLSYNNMGSGSGAKSKNNVAVGIKTTSGSALPNVNNNWYETISPASLYPKDLYVSQMKLVKNITVN
ncbi:glycosyl hydrolase family 28-related protein [Sphingobacterium spiritivorum]|uniref:glycosyl hydrolase family 28-related protein n=1 Tax=Sphingobacterium spiritivorum TaxID=258 RepID=UPI0019181AF9|nr:glycosyl hydrolase family 28-related protein [Sphingobacterium spiritivorum]QQT26379.1 carbohydrate binding domain-containing protein [Sphingobacterium spiritivorum]